MDLPTGGDPPFSVSPDGRYAALTMRRADAGTDSYCVGVVLIALDGTAPPRLLDSGGEPVPLVFDIRGVPAIPNGVFRPATPLWSPDGATIVYQRRDAGITQIWRVGLDGRPARQVTRLSTDALAVEWSGNTLLLTSRPSLASGSAAIEREGRTGYHYDARFWTLSEARPRPGPPLPLVVEAIDSRTGVGSRPAPPLAIPPGAAHPSARSPVGDRAWVASDTPELPFAPMRLHVEVRGRALPCREVCREGVAGLWWQGKTLLFLRSGGPAEGGTTTLWRWRVRSAAAPVRVLQTHDAIGGCQLAGASLICARETATHPRTLVRLDPDTGAMATIWDPNPEFGQVQLGHVERLYWSAADGVATYGDLVLPPHHAPGQRHPMIVVQYTSRGFLRGGTGDEYPIQLLAARGYAVLSFQEPVLPGAEHAPDLDALQRRNIENWAGRRQIFDALIAGVDAAIARGVIDPDAIGITGMSDGATTAQFALIHSTRFKAAAISSCCDDKSGLFALGLAYRDAVLRWGYPPASADGRAFWRDQSLVANADRLRTPLLMQLPDGEYRMGIESFSALDQQGAPVEMFVFPDEHHVKSHPAHRLAIYERSVAWFDFWLRGETRRAAPSDLTRWRALQRRAASR